METIYNGYISRHINRKISEPMARLLAKTRVTPNQVIWAGWGDSGGSGLRCLAAANSRRRRMVDGFRE
ncbi:hypothetical protein ES707_19001 [subsurface metagenome]